MHDVRPDHHDEGVRRVNPLAHRCYCGEQIAQALFRDPRDPATMALVRLG
jgi:hypothetical protein